jgi:uncharacterized pyridoxamine 5'-phosphate oxidase family protein
MRRNIFLIAVFCVFLSGCATLFVTSSRQTINNKGKEVKTMSNVDKVVEFLQNAKTFYIATVDGDQARVRPFGVAANVDGKISICTGSEKNVYRQIQENPKVEISAMTGDGKWIRLSGVLVDNTTTVGQNKMFDLAPELKNMYKDLNKFRVLSFQSGRATIHDFSGHTEEIELK